MSKRDRAMFVIECLAGIPCRRRRFGWGAAPLRLYIYQVSSAVP